LREEEKYLSTRALDADSWDEFLQRKGRLLELRRLLALVELWLTEAEELADELLQAQEQEQQKGGVI